MMNRLTKPEFEEVLVDVRRAYRLLYLYQDRILNTVRFIGERLGFDYEGGYPWFSCNTPREGKGDLENWAWDWLNMYYYEFRFREKYIQEQPIRFSVMVQSDTGFYDGAGAEGTEVHAFTPVADAQSRLRLLVGRGAWTHDFEEAFNVTNQAAHTTLFQGRKPDGSGLFLAKSYLLTDFLDESTTRQALANFVLLCQQNGIEEMRLA